MKFAICFRRSREESARRIRRVLEEIGEITQFIDVWNFKRPDADLSVAIGGDGTVIKCAKVVQDSSPIVGIKAGRLGFLSSYTLDDIEEFVEDLRAGTFKEEKRNMIEVHINGESNLALNDVVLQKDVDGRMLEIEVSVGGESPMWFFADGLIISTPTGSTAYNLSAGGPVVYPFSDTIQITPILPHFLFNRAVVVPSSKTISVSLDFPSNLLVDGKNLGKFKRVVVRKSDKFVKIIRSPSSDFFKIVKERIGFGRRLI